MWWLYLQNVEMRAVEGAGPHWLVGPFLASARMGWAEAPHLPAPSFKHTWYLSIFGHTRTINTCKKGTKKSEVESVDAVSAGGSVKFLPAV